jgi:hypothetical protein
VKAVVMHAPGDVRVESVPDPTRGFREALLRVRRVGLCGSDLNSYRDVLIRQFMKSFVITRFQAGLVQSAFYLGYLMLAMPEKSAGYFLTGSPARFGVGRFFSAWLMRFVQPSQLMAIYAVINTLLAAIGVLFPGWTGMIALLLTSFFMSLMFPTIFAQGIRGLGETAKLGRVTDRDGDRRRRGADADDGSDFDSLWRPSGRLPRPGSGVCVNRILFLC